jgi:hypothetical protein
LSTAHINKKFWEEILACFPLMTRTAEKTKKLRGTQINRQQDDLISFLTKITGEYTDSWTDTDGETDSKMIS